MAKKPIAIKIEYFGKPTNGTPLGYTTENGRYIGLQEGLSKRKHCEVLIHEFCHAAIWLTGYEFSREKHEKIASRISNTMKRLLK